MSARSNIPRHHFWKDDDAAFTVSSTLVPWYRVRDTSVLLQPSKQGRAFGQELGLRGGLIGVSLLSSTGRRKPESAPSPAPNFTYQIMRLHPDRP